MEPSLRRAPETWELLDRKMNANLLSELEDKAVRLRSVGSPGGGSTRRPYHPALQFLRALIGYSPRERETEEEMMEIVVMVRPMSIDVYAVCRAANVLP
jgi:hypothetical protein